MVPLPVPLPVLVLLPVLMWGCGLPLLLCVPPWPAPLLPVVPAPEPLPVPEPMPTLELLPVPVLVFVVVGLLVSRFRPWRGFSLGPPGLRGGWKSGPGPEDFDTPPPPPLPPLVVVCEEAPPWPLGVCPLGVSGPGLVGAAASVRSTEVLERSFWICSNPRSTTLTPPRISHPPPEVHSPRHAWPGSTF